MPGEITETGGDSGCCDRLTPEVTTASSPRSLDAKNARNAALLPKCITEKKFTIAVVVLVTVLIIVIISLAVKKTPIFPPCPLPVRAACPDSWIGYRGKCFYRSKEESTWVTSSKNCSSFNASLAVIDTKNELHFWVEFLRPSHYWFGLSRKFKQAWKWSNGTEFKNQFPVRGEGLCAYVNEKGASSTVCSTEKYFLCSQPESCTTGG
ncbi:C-type lectin domain family 2 member D-like [Python bivittatus]|uniref:C-type lectin domain family 2 member D-like n=1 Tax=Python bivittatus TaxID=176946 RepID=A0A9F2WHJ8_PYTBI|nr:C-type lectin domain family 2 member D-like [Python bivittatus]XP_007441971.1 C-type lectin domain family 2 member D-like [Python bivittatus]XP_025031242.1 C-type lectin domain family 2 member D-like [Python bivittatus]XP_025031243.1 C-type lectin domain family 2 member D-like [Python bivittatus]XP_025031244.1 C-type lectin domain family 2 member D-like [Python bivittatus]